MRYHEFLTELPQRRYPVDPNLGFMDNRHNYRLAKTVIKSSKKKLVKDYGADRYLYKFGNKFILVDEYNRRVLYYCGYKQKYYKFLNKIVTSEILHWRDRTVFGLGNTSEYVYLDLLLPLTGVLMSDHEHTMPGERFWSRLIETALSRRLLVYFINFTPVNPTINREIIYIGSESDLRQLELDGAVHGVESSYRSKRWIISVDPLDKPQ